MLAYREKERKFKLPDNPTPEHLNGLKKISDDANLLTRYSFKVDEERVTKAAFMLLKFSANPTPEQAVKIADALQREHDDLVRIYLRNIKTLLRRFNRGSAGRPFGQIANVTKNQSRPMTSDRLI